MSEPENDWRMQDVTHLAKDWKSPWTGELTQKGSQITRVSIVPLTKKKHLTLVLPNATALCLNASERAWESAREMRKVAKIDSSIKATVQFDSTGISFDFLERVMESIVMAVTALEAFVNDNIPDDFEYHTHKKNKVILEVMDKKAIERWISLDEKISEVIPKAKSIKSPKGTKCWEGYVELRRVRDRIVHLKKEDARSSGPELPTLWHKLFKINAPHIQVKNVIDHFVKFSESAPRWHSEYDQRKT